MIYENMCIGRKIRSIIHRINRLRKSFFAVIDREIVQRFVHPQIVYRCQHIARIETHVTNLNLGDFFVSFGENRFQNGIKNLGIHRVFQEFHESFDDNGGATLIYHLALTHRLREKGGQKSKRGNINIVDKWRGNKCIKSSLCILRRIHICGNDSRH